MTSWAEPTGRPLLRRTEVVLRPDPSRVITKLFLPGQEVLIRGDSRATPVLARILRLSESQVEQSLADTLAAFAGRHHDLEAVLAARFEEVAPRLDSPESLTAARRLLVGAFFTMEYAVEAAALFNPSMVPHPDQGGLAAGALRFVLTLRAVGEGHISSLELRSGTVDRDGRVDVDPARAPTVLPTRIPTVYAKEVFVQHYGRRRPDGESAQFVLDRLPDRFDRAQLDEALAALQTQTATRGPVLGTVERFEWMADSTYSVTFPPDSQLSARVSHPSGPAESHGIEDVRMVRHVDSDGVAEYRGTYTAYSGTRVAPQLVRTADFVTFHMSQLAGAAAQNKGLALFPRPVAGQDLALSRFDRESITLAASTGHRWEPVGTVQQPGLAWDLVQLGNCGAPIETPRGWLVLTHGVGPLRRYVLGAVLLDLDDPRRVRGVLPEPLLVADDEERTGYVPNVVYSCGALRHRDLLVLPYGCSDSAVRIAVVDLPGLLDALEATRRR